jgi:hypothetical protein
MCAVLACISTVYIEVKVTSRECVVEYSVVQ